MNPNAVEAMKILIVDWLDSIILPSKSSLGKGWDEPSNKLINSVFKAKHKWLSLPLASTVILDSLHEFFPNLLSDDEDDIRENLKLRDATDHILTAILGIPYTYKVHFELGLERSSNDLIFSVGERIECNYCDEELIKVDDGWTPLKGKKNFYSVIVDGYIPKNNNVMDSDAKHIAMSSLKFFIERGLHLGYLGKRHFSYGYHKSRPNMYVHKLNQNGGVEEKFVVNLPQDLANLINKTGDGLVKVDQKSIDKSILKTFIDIVSINNNENADKIMAASGWRFDSLADPSTAMRLVKICIGLESIYGDANGEMGITKALSDRCAYSLSRNIKERMEILDKCKKIYQLRSKIVHGVYNNLSGDDYHLLEYGDSLLKRSILNESTLMGE